ncbi:MAG: hypothetical protein Q8P13_04515 [bacterium]|nr:hypothetical protein [bacterium]
MKNINSLILPVLIIVLAASLRILPHPANFAPIGAMALFGGVYLDRRLALVLPLSAMIVSDIFIGFDGFDSRLVIYGSFLLIGAIGFWLRNHKSAVNVLGASLLSSVLFFLITNFGVLYTESLYPKTLEGLFQSYLMGIPFFRNTVLGDLFYTGAFFGGFELVKSLVVDKKVSFSKVK